MGSVRGFIIDVLTNVLGGYEQYDDVRPSQGFVVFLSPRTLLSMTIDDVYRKHKLSYPLIFHLI